MFGTVAAQLRFAASLVFGWPFDPRSLERLVEALRETLDEFGSLTPDGRELVGGPPLDEQDRREIQLRRFRQQATRAARTTRYYGELFRHLRLATDRLTWGELDRIPLTPKHALRDFPDAFVRSDRHPFLQAMTSGTTGRPTRVAFSQDELRVIAALSAISFLTSGQLSSESVVQISTSARGLLGNLGLAGACAHIGAQVYLAGVIDPAQSLALLAGESRRGRGHPRATLLSTYPSHLGEMVEAGLALGYRPRDFALERILIGGEVVTDGLRARARQIFGEIAIDETYAMTETIPFGGLPCEGGHLHFESIHGLLELLDPETLQPARPGALGRLVATPFPPFRETTLLLRYDTRDAARALDSGLGCSRRDSPATGPLEGKLDLAVRHADGWTTQRDVLTALERLAVVPLPARCGFWEMMDGVAVEVVVRERSAEAERDIRERLVEQCVPLRALRLVDGREQLTRPLPLRCDLREVTFSPAPVDAGAGSTDRAWA